MPGIRGPAGPPGDAGPQGIALWQYIVDVCFHYKHLCY